MLTLSELKKLPNLPVSHFQGYVNIPKGYVIKQGVVFGDHLLFNPETNHVIEYYYHETTGYGVSASDMVANGHYDKSAEYVAADPEEEEKPKHSN